MALLSAMFGAHTRRAALTSALLLLAGPGVASQAVRTPEYQVKAVFLFNFAQFVDWPPAAFSDSATPFVIGILGDDPFEGYLEQTVRGEQVRGRGFQLRRYHSVDEVKTCHILFISRPTGNRLDEVLASLRNRPILTVSDDDKFAERGGMIRFVTDRSRIRLQINLEAAQAASVTISSKLLRVADIVTPRGR